jgi:hypothetical protein
MGPSIAADAAKMSDADRYLANHYLSSDAEMFAELYKLKYTPSGKGAFSLGQKAAEKRFAKSLTILDDLLASEFK